MAKTGYQAVALDPAVAESLRCVAHYLSITGGKRVSMSEALAQLVQGWLDSLDLPDYVRQAILGAPQDAQQHAASNAQP
jgi:hypothetical protein